jgi:hypothetical protein
VPGCGAHPVLTYRPLRKVSNCCELAYFGLLSTWVGGVGDIKRGSVWKKPQPRRGIENRSHGTEQEDR